MSRELLASSRLILATALVVQFVATAVWLEESLAAVALLVVAIAAVGVVARDREGDWLRWAITAQVALGFALVGSRYLHGASSPIPWLAAIAGSIALGCVAFGLATRGRVR
jgi:hypothetical protein